MKIVCYKDKIMKALNSVVKGVASKTTMPILEGILIQTNDNEIKLTTYDLEIGIEYVMECDVKEQGNTVVNAIMFSEIIRKLPNTEIEIRINKNNDEKYLIFQVAAAFGEIILYELPEDIEKYEKEKDNES